jgi:hypothetical protein
VPLLDHLLAQVNARTAPLLARLPLAAIHGDLNDYNVLIGDGDGMEARGQRVTGIVDFGDMVWSYRVGDLAIAIAYAILGADDPLSVAAAMVRGYAKHIMFTNDELAALFGLVVLRLCASVCIAADQRGRQPDNEYLSISQTPIAELLPKLAAIPFRLAEVVFRQAVGRIGVPAHERVADFLRRQRSMVPVLGFDLSTEPSIVLDLSVASPLVDGDIGENAEPKLTKRVFGLMRDAGVSFAIGRYNEPRLLYVAPAFALGARPTDDHRTIHIGLDLWRRPRFCRERDSAGLWAGHHSSARNR